MKIASLKAYRIHVPLKRKVTHASYSRTESESILVRCELEDGTVGWGESVPRPYVTGDTADSVLSQYQATDFRPLTDWRWDSAAEMVSLCLSLKFAAAPDGPAAYESRGCLGNAARCAMELSLLDAATRSLNVPISEALTCLDEQQTLTQQLPEVRYSAVLTSMKPVKQNRL